MFCLAMLIISIKEAPFKLYPICTTLYCEIKAQEKTSFLNFNMFPCNIKMTTKKWPTYRQLAYCTHYRIITRKLGSFTYIFGKMQNKST